MSLFAEPPELDFGCVPATNKPYSVDFSLFNEGMEDVIYYRPTDQGKEKEAGERLEAIRRFQGKE